MWCCPPVNEINQHGEEGGFFVSYEGVREGKTFTKIRFTLAKSAKRDDRDMMLQGRARAGKGVHGNRQSRQRVAIGVAYQPTDAVLDQLRIIAPGWDRQALLARYREWSRVSATDSARALNVAGTSSSDFFHQAGTRPHRIGTNSRLPCLSRRITSTVSVGAML